MLRMAAAFEILEPEQRKTYLASLDYEAAHKLKEGLVLLASQRAAKKPAD